MLNTKPPQKVSGSIVLHIQSESAHSQNYDLFALENYEICHVEYILRD